MSEIALAAAAEPKARMTVVGVPCRVVREERARARSDGRIGLEHHLIPDPVVEAMAILFDRVAFLEARLSHLQGRVNGQGTESNRRETQRSTKP